MTKTIQKIPAPEGVDRVESGVVQFGDDWPGVFFRGDNAAMLAGALTAFVVHKIESGMVDRADFTLCGFLLAHAEDFADSDLTGTVPANIAAARVRLKQLVALADAPAAGSVQ